MIIISILGNPGRFEEMLSGDNLMDGAKATLAALHMKRQSDIVEFINLGDVNNQDTIDSEP